MRQADAGLGRKVRNKAPSQASQTDAGGDSSKARDEQPAGANPLLCKHSLKLPTARCGG